MNRKIFFGRSIRDLLIAVGPSFLILTLASILAYHFVDPAPPHKIVIATGNGEGNYLDYAKLYRDIIKEDGVELEIRASSGAVENLRLLESDRSGVDVGFVQDGLGSSDDDPNLVSLGSLYYEPIWIFYRGPREISRLSELKRKKIALGSRGGGTGVLAMRLLRAAGVDETNTPFQKLPWKDAERALESGQVEAAFFMTTADDPLIAEMLRFRNIRLMSVDQAEAVSRQFPYLHHLTLPHGAIDLKRNLPARDTDLVAPTATLLVRDRLHPALQYLLLKAASQVHDDPGVFERRNEFPVDKDYAFPISEEAARFYKSGAPFWQRFLPFWLATLLDRIILVIVPLLALIIPLVKLIPKLYQWRVKSKIYQRYGELKHLETQVDPETNPRLLRELDHIEERVNRMKLPLEYAEDLYVLREHIDFVRNRLLRRMPEKNPR